MTITDTSSNNEWDVGNEWSASVSLHTQYKAKNIRAYVCFLNLKSSCSPRIASPPVPGNLKDRSARFGYIIDDAFQRNYYENMGTDGVVKEEDYRNRYTKEAIVRRAIRLAKCTPGIVPFKTDKPGEVALFASFASHNPQWYALAWSHEVWSRRQVNMTSPKQFHSYGVSPLSPSGLL